MNAKKTDDHFKFKPLEQGAATLLRNEKGTPILRRPNIKSKTTAAWFALFLGGFGVDQFYLDRRKLGFTACSILGAFLLLHFGGHALTEYAYSRLRGGEAWLMDMMGAHSEMDEQLNQSILWRLGIDFQWMAQYLPTVSGLWSLIRSIELFAMDQEKFDHRYNYGRSSLPALKSPVPKVPTTTSPPPMQSSTADEISKLHKLKMDGVLTEEEFLKAKQRLVA